MKSVQFIFHLYFPGFINNDLRLLLKKKELYKNKRLTLEKKKKENKKEREKVKSNKITNA